jgi:peptidoglycan/xylan/chitin deacetylase (PgdA/CDA1 family)
VLNDLVFRAAGYVYSSPRKMKNRLLNIIDPPVVILLYHRVNTLPPGPHFLSVTPDNFRGQLLFLKKNFPILRFDDDWSEVRKPAIVITFDDSYADNLFNALPVLEDVGVPATFFVNTGVIGTSQEFWWDELERIVLGEWPFSGRFELVDSNFGRVWATSTVSKRHRLHRDIYPLMKKIDPARRHSWLTQLRRWAQAGEEQRESNRAMTVEELRRLGQSPWVTMGAHTVSHPQLSSLPAAEQRKEIEDSKKQLESWLGCEVTVFSYPFGGRRDYTQQTIHICREAGFAKAASVFPGQVHRWTDRYQIPRQPVCNWPAGDFAKLLRRYWIR